MTTFDLKRRLASELLGTAILVATVVGSGIMATKLTKDAGLGLLGAGLGSMASDMIPERSTRRALPYVVLGIGALLLVETFVSPLVFQACLGFEFLGRIAVAAALLMPLGFVMGMPFPLGMRLINSVSQSEAERKKLIAWGWGMNGYATVVGSAATVFMALFAGFQAVLFGAIIVYALGGLAMMRATRA